VVIAKIHEVPHSLKLAHGAALTHDQQTLKTVRGWAEEFNRKTPGLERDINLHTLILVGRDVVESILEIVKVEDCDLLILNWQGYSRTKNVIFGSKIDRILREAKCDLIVLKNIKTPNSILVTVNPLNPGPYLELVGEISKSLSRAFKSKLQLMGVIAQKNQPLSKMESNEIIDRLGLEPKYFDKITFPEEKSIVTSIIEQAKEIKADLVIVGASRNGFLKEIRFGHTPELLAKHLQTALMIVKGHAGIAEAFFERILRKFK
jgi:nucleotide-binding universal stress UspA family protein